MFCYLSPHPEEKRNINNNDNSNNNSRDDKNTDDKNTGKETKPSRINSKETK